MRRLSGGVGSIANRHCEAPKAPQSKNFTRSHEEHEDHEGIAALMVIFVSFVPSCEPNSGIASLRWQ
jgi:hypothetical protein